MGGFTGGLAASLRVASVPTGRGCSAPTTLPPREWRAARFPVHDGDPPRSGTPPAADWRRRDASVAGGHRSCYDITMSRGRTPRPRIAVELTPDPDGGGYTAHVPDLPAYGEGATAEEAIKDLKEAIRGYIDTFGLTDALARISPPFEVRQIDWDLAELSRG